jgi:beta-glucosidase
MAQAVEAVTEAGADVAVVVVGTTDEWETEGNDRTTIALPGEQDELISRVAAVAPRTVVIVNAGSPVAMPWIDEVDAVVIASFAGLETGPAVAEVVAGDADPGGRLPISYPRRLEDCPAWPHYLPADGRQTYAEGRLMGYRGHDASRVEPLWAFGHGLSYGTSEWIGARLSATAIDVTGSVTLAVDIVASGERPVTDVVQAYVTHPDPDMPPKSLVAFGRCVLQPGEATTVELEIPASAFRRWDDDTAGWTVDSGRYEVLVAASAADVRFRLPLDVTR